MRDEGRRSRSIGSGDRSAGGNSPIRRSPNPPIPQPGLKFPDSLPPLRRIPVREPSNSAEWALRWIPFRPAGPSAPVSVGCQRPASSFVYGFCLWKVIVVDPSGRARADEAAPSVDFGHRRRCCESTGDLRARIVETGHTGRRRPAFPDPFHPAASGPVHCTELIDSTSQWKLDLHR